MALSTYPSTEAYVARNIRWGIENYFFWSQSNSLDWDVMADKVKVDAYGQRAHNTLSGLQSGTLKMEGLAASERNAVVSLLRAWQGAPAPVNTWFTPQGITPLSPITFFPGRVMDSSLTGKVADAVDFKTEVDASGTYSDGFILLTPDILLSGASGASSTDVNMVTVSGTGTPTATTSGGAGALHVYAYDGGTTPSVTVTINHSPDGDTYTPLCSFSAQSATSAAQSQRIEISPSTTINPYIQATWSTDGSPTDIQVLCMFGRYPNLG